MYILESEENVANKVSDEKSASSTALKEASSGRHKDRPQERKVVYLWIPRQYLHMHSMDVQGFVSDVNKKILERGLITYDGQILRTPITDIGVGPGFIEVEHRWPFSNSLKVGDSTDVLLESGGETRLDSPPRREWGEPQIAAFGLANPYQMGEDADAYTTSHLGTLISEPYLFPDELIVAIVHGVADDYYFYCECHSAEVVYTTRDRLVCMGCGAMHLALRAPVHVTPKRLLTSDDWFRYFGNDAELRYEDVDVAFVDFRDIEYAEAIWTSDRWLAAKHRFIFFARSTPEEIEAAIRGTEADPSMFLESGWKVVELTPPPAEQLAEDSLDVDLVDNSGHAVRDGIVCFLESQTNPPRLINAIPHLFRAIELLLKSKLDRLDPDALSDHPNNPIVMDRLAVRGILITDSERSAINRLRRLRNQLQHGAAKFNYRAGLAIARDAIIFIDRFGLQEVDCWLGDVVSPPHRLKLLEIRELSESARRVVAGRIEAANRIQSTEITTCSTCSEHTVVRKYPNTGAICYYCGQPPSYRDG